MSKKGGSRFGYLSTPNSDETEVEALRSGHQTPVQAELQTVPKGQGRMEQDRTQLNVRIPTALKRRAGAKATLDGRSLGEVLEAFLRAYVEE